MLADIAVTIWAGHRLGDFWLQTSAMAKGKGGTGWSARWYCVQHVLVLTAVKAVFLLTALVVADVGVGVSVGRMALALAVDAVSHYVLDRREPVRKVAKALGNEGFYHMGRPRPGHDDQEHLGTGAHALDQAAHFVFAWVAALIVAA